MSLRNYVYFVIYASPETQRLIKQIRLHQCVYYHSFNSYAYCKTLQESMK